MTKVNIKEDMKDKTATLPHKEIGATPIQSFSPTKINYNKDTDTEGNVSEYYEGNVDDVIKLLKEQGNPQPIIQTIKVNGEELRDAISKVIDETDLMCDEEDER